MLNIKLSWKVIVIGLIVLAALGFIGYKYVEKLKQDKVVAELLLIKQKQLNDSTIVKLASTSLDKQTLASLLYDAQVLNGKLIAAVAIQVPVHDTTVVHDTLPTQLKPDFTRVATFHDSTFAGLLDGTVTAPPWPSALRMDYTLTRPAFTPKIGFIRIGDSTAVVVEWGKEKVQAMAPYVSPKLIPTPHKFFGWYVGSEYGVIDQQLDFRAGGRISPTTTLDLQAGLDTRKGLRVGIEKRF